VFFDSLIDSGNVGDKEIITNDLDFGTDAFGNVGPSLPVVLVEGVLD
jgi:hypothetical protein